MGPRMVLAIALIGASIGSALATTTATAAAVLCAPDEQTIQAGQSATLQAVGGDGTYKWDISGGGIVERGGNQEITISYRTAGTKAVRVSSSGSSALCLVKVQDQSVPPSADGQLSIAKTARVIGGANQESSETVDVAPDQTVQFTIEVHSLSTVPLNDLRVQDTVPLGMTYVVGSTFIENQNVVDGLTGIGLTVGTLQPGDHFTVQWSAIADQTAQLGPGLQELQPRAAVLATGVTTLTDGVVLRISGTAVAGPGGVQTGPGDVTAIAVVVAALSTLFYTAYTRSAVFRRSEASKLSEDQGPLDFRV